jgi:biopolymer transport protein ExbD
MTRVFFSVRRLQRGQATSSGRHGLNLVPLMDVFTILVFFFLVNSSAVTPAGNQDIIALPESVADQPPRQTLVVTLTKGAILLQGAQVAPIDALLNAPEGGIEALTQALREQNTGQADADKPTASVRELTIMADKSIPFRLLRKVMLSCTQAGYQRIALSVLQKPSHGG